MLGVFKRDIVLPHPLLQGSELAAALLFKREDLLVDGVVRIERVARPPGHLRHIPGPDVIKLPPDALQRLDPAQGFRDLFRGRGAIDTVVGEQIGDLLAGEVREDLVEICMDVVENIAATGSLDDVGAGKVPHFLLGEFLVDVDRVHDALRSAGTFTGYRLDGLVVDPLRIRVDPLGELGQVLSELGGDDLGRLGEVEHPVDHLLGEQDGVVAQLLDQLRSRSGLHENVRSRGSPLRRVAGGDAGTGGLCRRSELAQDLCLDGRGLCRGSRFRLRTLDVLGELLEQNGVAFVLRHEFRLPLLEGLVFMVPLLGRRLILRGPLDWLVAQGIGRGVPLVLDPGEGEVALVDDHLQDLKRAAGGGPRGADERGDGVVSLLLTLHGRLVVVPRRIPGRQGVEVVPGGIERPFPERLLVQKKCCFPRGESANRVEEQLGKKHVPGGSRLSGGAMCPLLAESRFPDVLVGDPGALHERRETAACAGLVDEAVHVADVVRERVFLHARGRRGRSHRRDARRLALGDGLFKGFHAVGELLITERRSRLVHLHLDRAVGIQVPGHQLVEECPHLRRDLHVDRASCDGRVDRTEPLGHLVEQGLEHGDRGLPLAQVTFPGTGELLLGGDGPLAVRGTGPVLDAADVLVGDTRPPIGRDVAVEEGPADGVTELVSRGAEVGRREPAQQDVPGLLDILEGPLGSLWPLEERDLRLASGLEEEVLRVAIDRVLRKHQRPHLNDLFRRFYRTLICLVVEIRMADRVHPDLNPAFGEGLLGEAVSLLGRHRDVSPVHSGKAGLSLPGGYPQCGSLIDVERDTGEDRSWRVAVNISGFTREMQGHDPNILFLVCGDIQPGCERLPVRDALRFHRQFALEHPLIGWPVPEAAQYFLPCRGSESFAERTQRHVEVHHEVVILAGDSAFLEVNRRLLDDRVAGSPPLGRSPGVLEQQVRGSWTQRRSSSGGSRSSPFRDGSSSCRAIA